MSEVCHGVGTEPNLQPVNEERFKHKIANREDGARLDIVAVDFWGKDRQCAFFDIRVFNPFAHSYRNTSLSQCYRQNKLEKKRIYDERVREIEHGSFSPLVFSTSGGMSTTATVVFKRIASRIARKQDKPYSKSNTLDPLQTKFFFTAISDSMHSWISLYLPPPSRSSHY